MTDFETAMLSFLQDAQNEFNSEKEVDYFIKKHAPKLMEAARRQLMNEIWHKNKCHRTEQKLLKSVKEQQKMTKTIYISGPITDQWTDQPREGWQQDFLDAEAKLRRMGFNVINPVDIAREVEDMKRILHEFVPTPIDSHGNPLPPTRADYIMADLQRMKLNHTYDRLHGVYVIGDYIECYNSHGVQMELLMAEVLDAPIYAECRVDCRVDHNIVYITDGGALEELLND